MLREARGDLKATVGKRVACSPAHTFQREKRMVCYSAYNTFDEIPSRDPLWGQNVTYKIFPKSELWFSHNLDFLCLGMIINFD